MRLTAQVLETSASAKHETPAPNAVLQAAPAPIAPWWVGGRKGAEWSWITRLGKPQLGAGSGTWRRHVTVPPRVPPPPATQAKRAALDPRPPPLECLQEPCPPWPLAQLPTYLDSGQCPPQEPAWEATCVPARPRTSQTPKPVRVLEGFREARSEDGSLPWECSLEVTAVRASLIPAKGAAVGLCRCQGRWPVQGPSPREGMGTAQRVDVCPVLRHCG